MSDRPRPTNAVPIASMFAVERAVHEELLAAIESHGRFASAHEGYAVLLEELDEVWTEVKRKRGERNLVRLYRELTQVAAMAEKFMLEIEHELPAMMALSGNELLDLAARPGPIRSKEPSDG